MTRSVNHIFSRFLDDNGIEEVFETQSSSRDPRVAVEIDGTLTGEIVLCFPRATLDEITRRFINKNDIRSIRRSHGDVAGEIANLITGTFANQLQYTEHALRLSAPEFNDDPITIKALYDNINLSFMSRYGGFDIDLYFRENL